MPRNILFVCTENACRSQMAEAFLNHLSRGKERAMSAGTVAAKEVDPLAIEVMREVGLDISRQRPKLLTPELLKNGDKVIIMGCGVDTCPATLTGAEDWGLENPKGGSITRYRKVRDEIYEKVRNLVGE